MTRVITLLVLATALLMPSPLLAHSHKKKGLEIIHPWTRAMPDRSITTVIVSMTIKNCGGTADKLLRAWSPLAHNVEIRSANGTSGTAGKQAAVLTIGAGKSVELKRDTTHLLLTGFKKQLLAYESFVMTLAFEKAGEVVIEVMVEEPEELEKPKSH